jgi:Cu/Ag efflux pump CusA
MATETLFNRNIVLEESMRNLVHPLQKIRCRIAHKVATTSMEMAYIEFPSGPFNINRERESGNAKS